MAFEENDDNEEFDEVKRVEALIASKDLATRADGLTEMIRLYRGIFSKPAADAVPYILAAIDLNEELDRKVELSENYWQLGDVLEDQGKTDEAIEALEKSIALAEESLTEGSVPMVAGALGRIYGNIADYKNASAWYERSFWGFDAQMRRGQAAQAAMQASRAFYALRDFAHGIEFAKHAFALFQQSSMNNSNMAMVDALNQEAWGLSFNGEQDFERLHEVLNLSASINDLIDHKFGDEVNTILSAKLAVDTGMHNPTTIEKLDALLARTRERNDATGSATMNYFRAYYFNAVGRTFEAIGILKALLTVKDVLDPRIETDWILELLLEVEQKAGRNADAAKTATQAAAEFASRGQSSMEAEYLQVAGECWLAAGEPVKAIAELEKVHVMRAAKNVIEDLPADSALARAYVQTGRHTEALVLANELLERLDAIPEAMPGTAEAVCPPEALAQLHEIKLDALLALGDADHAEAEARFCKQAYESIEDFAAVTRMHQTLSSLKKSSTEVDDPTRYSELGSPTFFSEGR